MFLYYTCHNIRILYILFDGYYRGSTFCNRHFFKCHCRFCVVFEAYLMFSGEIFCCRIIFESVLNCYARKQRIIQLNIPILC